MSKFDAALNARRPEPAQASATGQGGSGTLSQQAGYQNVSLSPRKAGRPAGKRSDEANTQVTGYVPAHLYYDVRIKLIEQRRKNRSAKSDFSDLLREWMERWLAEQP